MTDFIPIQNGKGFRDIRTTDADRAFIPQHYIQDEGRIRIVYPANGSSLGMLVDPATNGLLACIRLDHAEGPTSLIHVLTVEDLRALSEGMLDIANQMETAAADMLAATLAKKGPAA